MQLLFTHTVNYEYFVLITPFYTVLDRGTFLRGQAINHFTPLSDLNYYCGFSLFKLVRTFKSSATVFLQPVDKCYDYVLLRL